MGREWEGLKGRFPELLGCTGMRMCEGRRLSQESAKIWLRIRNEVVQETTVGGRVQAAEGGEKLPTDTLRFLIDPNTSNALDTPPKV